MVYFSVSNYNNKKVVIIATITGAKYWTAVSVTVCTGSTVSTAVITWDTQ